MQRCRPRSLHRAVGTALVGVVCTASALSAAAPASISGPATGNQPAELGQAVQLRHPAFPGPTEIQIGESVQGRPITAINRRGSVGADRTVVVVGVVHGDEVHGRRVTDRLLTAALPTDLDLWIVPTLNPDAEVTGSHRNARGVDLNRNWPTNWESGTRYSSGRYFSGSGPASEPEVQAMMSFLKSIDPSVTVWFHSPWNTIDCNVARVGSVCTDYAAAVGQSVSFTSRPGTATDWLMTAGFGVSFVVEFASSAPSAASVQRHVDAVLDLG